MNRPIIILALLIALIPDFAAAKRMAPPDVEPVIYEGLRIIAPNNDGRRAYVQAWDAKTNKMLWEVTVFRNAIDPLLEEDVQHVYIEKMIIREGKLIVSAESGKTYSLDLKTRDVTRLK